LIIQSAVLSPVRLVVVLIHRPQNGSAHIGTLRQFSGNLL
jgi:hypothetical protein